MIAQPIWGKILLSKEILISEQARDRLTEMNIKSFLEPQETNWID